MEEGGERKEGKRGFSFLNSERGTEGVGRWSRSVDCRASSVASPVSRGQRCRAAAAISACNVAIKSGIFLWNGARTHCMALRKLHSQLFEDKSWTPFDLRAAAGRMQKGNKSYQRGLQNGACA